MSQSRQVCTRCKSASRQIFNSQELMNCVERSSNESHVSRRFLAVSNPGLSCDCWRACCWQSGDYGGNACIQPCGWNLPRHASGYDHGLGERVEDLLDRKSTRLNSSHLGI